MATVLEDMVDAVKDQNKNPKPVFLPHSTWDKMGDLLANSGGRLFGLFDELTSFFTSMNMYSSSKLQVSDTREYQDFLLMFNGQSKARETS